MGKRLTIWVVLLLVAVTTADARTLNVRKDGTGDYTVIQDAVDHAVSGDSVRIGPGRYEEYRPYTSYPPDKRWTFNVYVSVNVSSITLIGAGADLTIIGPPTRIWTSPDQPKAICALSHVSSLVVEDLSMENICDGVYRDEGGSLVLRRCNTSGCDGGVVSWGNGGTLLEDCHFQNTSFGVVSWYPAQDIVIAGCSFFNCQATFDGTTNVEVINCAFRGYPVGCQYANASTGTISGSTFLGQSNYSVVIATGSVVDLENNLLLGGRANLRVRDWSRITGSGNELIGGTYASLVMVSNSTADFHDNQVLHGTGPSVLIECCYPNLPIVHLNLTDNYWGSDDAGQVASWIWDGNDNPALKVLVDYLPMSGGPIATEPKSWGELKTLYAK